MQLSRQDCIQSGKIDRFDSNAMRNRHIMLAMLTHNDVGFTSITESRIQICYTIRRYRTILDVNASILQAF